MASTHYPQTNGATKCANRMLVQMIRKFVMSQHDQWASYLPLFEFAYNSATHAVTEIAPFVAELGRLPIMPVAMLLPERDLPVPSRLVRQHVHDLTTKLSEIRKAILAKDEAVTESQNLIPVGSDELWSLLPGDKVLVHAPYLPVHMDFRKHSMAWKGPYVVVKEITPDAYELTGLAKGNANYVPPYQIEALSPPRPRASAVVSATITSEVRGWPSRVRGRARP